MTETVLDELVANACEFLHTAIASLETQPKQSVINFYTAIELVLKARLVAEHWSLIVKSNASKSAFSRGDFVSIGFEEICKKLEDVLEEPLPNRARKAFDKLRQHRNKMVHFFDRDHEDDAALREQIVIEQLRAWHDLHELVISRWKEVFSESEGEFAGVEEQLKTYEKYLKVKFDALTESIEKETKGGVRYLGCNECGFPAARVKSVTPLISEVVCRVCNCDPTGPEYHCSKCGTDTILEVGGQFVCKRCGLRDGLSEIASNLDEQVVTPDNYMDVHTDIHCGECDEYGSVVEKAGDLFCVNCFAEGGRVVHCEWCNTATTGVLDDDSMWTGCSQCSGKSGDLRDDFESERDDD